MTDWIVTSSVLIVIVAALRYLLRGKISLRLQYALWAIVLVRLLLPVQLGQASFSVLNAVEEQQELQLTVREPFFYIGETPDLAVSEVEDSTLTEAEREALEKQLYLEYLEEMAEYATPVSLSTVLYAVWIAGGTVTAAVFLVSNLRFSRRLRRSRRKTELQCGDLAVYVSPLVDTPCLFGLFHPAVYVTEAVLRDETALRHVLAHEATHDRHGDHIWAILRGLCLALHWYNPLVWLAAALSRRDAELACDEGTLHRLGEEERTAYGETLIALTCGKKRGELLLTATTMTGSKRTLRERITLIARKPKMALYTLIAALLVVTVAAGCTFTGQKEPAPPEELPFSYIGSEPVETQVLSAVQTYILAHAAILNELAGDADFITEATLFSITPDSTGGAAESAMCMYDALYYFQCADPMRLEELSGGGFAEKWEAEGTNGNLPTLNDTIHYRFRGQVLAPYSALGSGADVEQTPVVVPDSTRLDAALERLRSLQPEELGNIYDRAAAIGAETLASLIQRTVEHRIDRTEPLTYTPWSVNLSLGSKPQSSLERQEHISIRISPTEEEILEIAYRAKDDVTVTFYTEDSDLYWTIRNAYRTEDTLDTEAMALYRALLEAEAQAILDRSAGWPQPCSGYEIVSFRQVETFRQDGADYAVYDWDAAFLSDDPSMVGWAGGMWLDDQCRIRQLVKNTRLLVRTVNGEADYLFAGNDWVYENQQDIVDIFAGTEPEAPSGFYLPTDSLPVRCSDTAAHPDALLSAAALWLENRAAQFNALSGVPGFIMEGEIRQLTHIPTASVSEFMHVRLYALDYRLRLTIPDEVNMELPGMIYSQDAEGLWLVEADRANSPILVMAYRYNDELWTYAGALTEAKIAAQYGGDYTAAAAEFYDSVRSTAK